MHHVVITGVSTGIGYATAKRLIAKDMHVFGSVRKEGDAQRLCAALGAAFTPLYFDVTVEPAVQAAAQVVRERLAGATLFGLVNNAGIAVAGPLLHVPLDQVRQQLEVNIVGQLIVTQAFAPLLGADRHYNRRPGRIVMVSSISGRNGLPFLGPYAASKHGLEGMAESLRREVGSHRRAGGPQYSGICPRAGPFRIITPMPDGPKSLQDDQPNLASTAGDVTLLLHAVAAGDGAAPNKLLELIYDTCGPRPAAHGRRAQGHTLQATALVHEAYIRLLGNPDRFRWAGAYLRPPPKPCARS